MGTIFYGKYTYVSHIWLKEGLCKTWLRMLRKGSQTSKNLSFPLKNIMYASCKHAGLGNSTINSLTLW